MISNYRSQTNNASLLAALKTVEDNVSYNLLNCVRIGIVDEFNKDNLTVKIRIANKHQVGQTPDGTPILKDYPPIYAKVYFMGWINEGITFPLTPGMEGIVLFNDREIESWFINGEVNPLSYERAHSWSDAIFLCGLRSLPNMIEFVADCFNIFYKNTYIRLLENTIAINGDTTLTGNLTQTGNITQTGSTTSSGTITGASLVDQSGATGTFISQDSKTITVTNGIIKSIS